MDAQTRPIRSYRDLIVWQKAMKLVSLAYAIARRLPKDETYGLASQIRRAAVSVPANIAEGHGRAYRGEYRYSVSVAHGSLMELETEVLITVQEGFCTEAQTSEFWLLSPEVGRLLNGLSRALEKPAKGTLTPDP